MLQKMKAKVLVFTGLVMSAAVAAPAMAQTAGSGVPDVSGIVTQITADLGPIGQIGAAVLTVVFGIAVYKWLRRTA